MSWSAENERIATWRWEQMSIWQGVYGIVGG